MPPACICFDLDGTLVDSLPGIAFSIDAALSECGHPPRTTALRALVGPPIRSMLASVTGESDPARLDALVAAFRRSYDSHGWRKTVLYPGAIDVLASLAPRRLCLVTNKPKLATEKITGHFGIGRFFERSISRDSTNPPFASKARMLEAALDGQSGILVGDTPEDLEAGAQAGIPVIIVEHGYGDFTRCDRGAPLARIQTLKDLTSILNSL